jgi:ribosomal protein L11 methyltransferase
MIYKQIHITLDPVNREFYEILFALLDAYGFEGIYEQEKIIDAYIGSDCYSPDNLEEIQASLLALGCRMNWESRDVPEQNWNLVWESNFEPVIVSNICVIRAPFHPEFPKIQYQITIEPKMAFGTGHHQSTRLMIEQIIRIDLASKKVLDMGCGTGILGILSSMMGASEVVAIDIDNWACQSAKENAAKNHIKNMSVILGDNKVIPEVQFDVILANINRNILLEQMNDYSRHTHPDSLILLSGILEEDRETVSIEAEKNLFIVRESHSLDKWFAMLFERK